MTIDLSGKVALVTGGGNRIGAACCRAFDRDGAAPKASRVRPAAT